MRPRTILAFLLFVCTSVSASPQNLIVNGSFQEGTTGWDSLLVSGTANASYSIANSVYTFKIAASGSESWNVQLKQRGISLLPRSAYRFSFEASAAAERDIEASVGMDNGPYTIYSSATVPRYRLSTTKQRFDTYFMMDSVGDSSARVQFNCGLAAIDVSLTGIVLEKISGSMIKLLAPSGGEQWTSGVTNEIRWVSAGIGKVALSYSTDAGMSWTVIDTAAPNTGRYYWKVPLLASAWCLVRVLDAENGTSGDTSAATFETGTFFNIVRNGDFADSTGTAWNPLGVYGSAKAAGKFSGGEYLITIDSGGTEPWHIQFTQSHIPLVNNETYLLTFTAYSDAPRPFMVNIGESGGAYSTYLDDSTRGKLSLTATPQPYTLEFTMSRPSDTNARLDFNAGTGAAVVHLDNVSLYRKAIVRTRYCRFAPAHSGRSSCEVTIRVPGALQRTLVSMRGVPTQVSIVDLRGKAVRTLLPLGRTIIWDGRTDRGHFACPGVYIVRITGATGTAAVPVAIPAR